MTGEEQALILRSMQAVTYQNVIALAAAAGVHEDTARRFFEGRPMKPSIRQRCEAASHALGLASTCAKPLALASLGVRR